MIQIWRRIDVMDGYDVNEGFRGQGYIHAAWIVSSEARK